MATHQFLCHFVHLIWKRSSPHPYTVTSLSQTHRSLPPLQVCYKHSLLMSMRVPLFTHTFCDRCRHSIFKCLCISQEYHRQVTSGEAIDDFVWLCTLFSSSLPEWWKVELWKYLYFSWCSFCLVTDFNCLNNPFNLFPLPCGKNKVFAWWQLSDPLVTSNVFQWRYTILT